LFPIIEEDNLKRLEYRLKIFCQASSAKVSNSKSIMLSWNENPIDWLEPNQWEWGDSNKQVRFLGIPFSVNPSLKNMWNWIYEKINKKLGM